MDYSCERCGKDFGQMSNLKNHINRKVQCENIFGCTKTIEEMLMSLEPDRSSFRFACPYCEKRFETSQTIYQHKKHCKAKREKEVNDELIRLRQEIEVLKSTNHGINITNNTITNNNITNNNNNITVNNNITIVLNNFGAEDLSHVLNDKAFLDKCLSSVRTGIPQVVEKIFYDEAKPENKNVLLKSSKRKTAVVYKDGTWVEKHMNQVVPDMLKHGSNILSTHLEAQPKADIDDDKHEVYVKKQNYISSVMAHKKPEFDQVASAVKAMIHNHRS